MKALLFCLYIVIGCLVALFDIFKAYGEDGLLFFLTLRPYLGVIKGIFWPLTLIF